MKKYTLSTMRGTVTASPEVLNLFICGVYAISGKYEKEGKEALAEMYREEASSMFDELQEKIMKGCV